MTCVSYLAYPLVGAKGSYLTKVLFLSFVKFFCKTIRLQTGIFDGKSSLSALILSQCRELTFKLK